AVRKTRIDGETAPNLALALEAPFHFATSLGGRRASLLSFKVYIPNTTTVFSGMSLPPPNPDPKISG
ncbi:MAG: hypothetical protein ACU4EQ_04055, partial [Candidatus Nitrosoglobus sp.]